MLLLSLLADFGFAVVSYLLAYRVRFDAPALAQFLPGAIRSLPFVVGCQIAAFVAVGVYRATRRTLWPKILLAVSLGTAAGALLTRLVIGFEGISRASFLVNALLLALSAFTWRGALMLRALSHPSVPGSSAGSTMVDRGDRVQRAAFALVGLARYRQLLKSLILRDLKLKYRGSVLGFAWSLLNPLLMLSVYTLVFTYIIRATDAGFVFRLLVGLLAWGFFSNSATMATGAIVENRGLIKSVFFPRTLLPVATVLFNLAQFILNLLVFIPLMLLLFGVAPGIALSAFPVFLVLQVAATIGVALLIAAATASFRDVRHLLEVGLNVLFWTTPIVYNYRQLPQAIRPMVILSPMSPFIVAYQQIFVYREWPELSVWLVATLYAAMALVSGFVLFVVSEERFAEQV